VAKGKKKGGRPRIPPQRAAKARVAAKPAAAGAWLARALDIWKKGDLAQADALCQEALRKQPHNVDANQLAGVIRLQRNEPEAALRYLETALEGAPANARLVENHARCLERLQRHEDAEQAFRKAAALQPKNGALLLMLGELLERRQRMPEAEPLYRQALELDPKNPQAWHHVGHIERRAQKLETAERAFRKALELDPKHAAVWNSLGALLAERDRHGDAQDALRKATELKPKQSIFWANLGRSLERTEKLAEAEQACLRATELRPDEPTGWLRLAVVQRRLGRDADAAASLERSRSLNSPSAEWWNDYGLELKTLGRYDDARAAYERALEITPANVRPWTNIGNLRKELGDFDGAEAAYRVAMESGYVPARYNLTLMNGLRGRLEAFWTDYEWRFAADNNAPDAVKLPDLPMPMWRGEPLAGKRLLVWIEQGFGDQMQFIRYARLVHEAGAQATWVVSPPLKALLRTLPWPVDLRSTKEVSKDARYDYWSFALSLPRWFDTRLDTIPAEVPYLKADPKKVEHWRTRLARWKGKRRIGLAWAGNPKHVNDRNRSIPLAEFAPLAKLPDCVFLSLQKGEREKELASPPAGMEIVHLGAELKDFTDTAALMQHLDLLISCDSSPAHLAGALARPVWTLLPYTPDWRWMTDRSDSPWYPSMRLFRQRKVGDWAGVMGEVAEALAADTRGALARAVAEHRAGRLDEAEKLYRSVLARDPQSFDPVNMLGAIALQRGDAIEAERRILEALDMRPQHPVALSNLGNALCQLGRWDDAVERYRQALAVRPDYPDARKNLDQALRFLARQAGTATAAAAPVLQPAAVPAPAPAPAAAPAKGAGPKNRAFMQQTFDVAVLVRTILRPSLVAAIESVFAQDFGGRIQILVGVDRHEGKPDSLLALRDRCPPNIGFTVIDPGYSTAKRNGGLYSASAGGALLTSLAYLANAPRIACLDDDNRMLPPHLRLLLDAIGDKPWAFSLRWFVNPANRERICIDGLESVGPGRGLFEKRFGGFVDMNSWVLDKTKLHMILPWLCIGPYQGGGGNDRKIFEMLAKHPFGETREATSEYVISPSDQNHAMRMKYFAAAGYDVTRIPVAGTVPSRIAGVHAPRS
jgi:tetratricopeptide (TPR) repeat protein